MASDYPNSGALFRADAEKKRENAKWPDYEGSAEIDGTDYWISGWMKEGKRGKFMSLSFKPKEARKARNGPPPNDDAEDVW